MPKRIRKTTRGLALLLLLLFVGLSVPAIAAGTLASGAGVSLGAADLPQGDDDDEDGEDYEGSGRPDID